MKDEGKYFPFLILVLALKAIGLLLLILSGRLHLAPDEAQYWTWSQSLDWGYYSKPPGIAWQMSATTWLFGNTELGVRAGSVLLGFLMGIILYQIARRAMLTDAQSFWTALLFAFSPLGFYLSFAATTDIGSIFFFLCAILATPHFMLAGLAILCGALFKWTAFAFWLFVIYPHWKKKSLWIGMGISLLALLPAIYWNWAHDWATFKHVIATPSRKGGNFFGFLGAQCALLNPILFAFLVLAIVKAFRFRQHLFLAAFPAAVSIYFILSLFTKMQPNWAAYLYATGFILIVWYAYPRFKVWLNIALWTSIVAIIALLFLPLPYKMSPFRQNLGWEKIAPALLEAGYNPETDFLFADKYQTTSLLSFYGPTQKRAYFFNLHHRRRNQFSYFEQMNQAEIGKSGYFVLIEKGTNQEPTLSQLKPYFENVALVNAITLYPSEKYILVFKATNFNGKMPDEVDLF